MAFLRGAAVYLNHLLMYCLPDIFCFKISKLQFEPLKSVCVRRAQSCYILAFFPSKFMSFFLLN